MDGVFCPMLTVGPPVVRAMRTPMLKDVHLMVDDPLTKVDAFVAAGADLVTFHLEGARNRTACSTSSRRPSTPTTPSRGLSAASG